MSPVWSIRQFACIDTQGKVVSEAITTKKGIGLPAVVGWRVRWDAPGYPGRSSTFTKSKYDTPTAAHAAAQDFVDLLRAAAKADLSADERGRPLEPGVATDPTSASNATTAHLTLKALGEAWIAARGGEPKTIQQHETSLAFALNRLTDDVAADAVTSTQCQELLLARRYTPGTRARKLVRMGVITEADDRARMCSVRAEKLFVQDLKAIFEFGIVSKPATVDGNPMFHVKARGKNDEPADPSSMVTFQPTDVRGIAALLSDLVFRALILLRGVTMIRTGEFANVTVDDVDVANHVIQVTGTEGEAPSRLTPTGQPRSRNHLKQREDGHKRPVEYPDTPGFNKLMAELITEARNRHRCRTKRLTDLAERYRHETGKAHLVADVETKLRDHRNSSPRLITMPDGSPFQIGRFDRDVWKPALRRYYPIADPNDKRYEVLRETSFYNLRAAAIEFWIEDVGEEESRVAEKAGHSVEMQRRRYRKPRGTTQRAENLDRAALIIEESEG